MNNGLDSPPQWTDLGRYEVTKDDRDRARFKVTSLRNIDLTPPYMHDGRFTTLEEVVRHYNTGVKGSPTVERDLLQFNLRPGGLGLSETQIADVVAFLKTLTDPDLVASAEYKP
jgi:cytochrome c peroxidase